MIQLIHMHPDLWGLFAVFAGAFAEYVLPPLPADTAILAGSLLVVTGLQSIWIVGLAAVAGGIAGCAAVYGLGRSLSQPDGTLRGEQWIGRIFGASVVPRFVERFRKYGYRVILVNRALPGVRGITFVAAGAVRLDFARTMVAGFVSHALWTGLILGVGVSVGGRWEKIHAAFVVYESAAYGVAVGVAGLAALIWWIRRKRGGSA